MKRKVKKSTKTTGKLVFIDTSSFINCAAEEVVGLDLQTLEKISKKIESGEIVLVLPENINIETLRVLESTFEKFKDKVKKHWKAISESQKDEPAVVKTALVSAEKSTLEEIDKKYSKSRKLIEKIFKAKSTKRINITGDSIIAGIKRAVLKKPPFTDPRQKSKENSHSIDQDCIAVESILSFLSGNKEYKELDLIICTSDVDYFTQDDELSPEIRDELAIHSKGIRAYQSPVEMLKKEFEQKYSKKQEKEYKEIQPKIEEDFLLSALNSNNPSPSNFLSGFITEAMNKANVNSFIVPSNNNDPYPVLSHQEFRVCDRCKKVFLEEAESWRVGVYEPINIYPKKYYCPECKKKTWAIG